VTKIITTVAATTPSSVTTIGKPVAVCSAVRRVQLNLALFLSLG